MMRWTYSRDEGGQAAFISCGNAVLADLNEDLQRCDRYGRLMAAAPALADHLEKLVELLERDEISEQMVNRAVARSKTLLAKVRSKLV
jgi:hypothetical protein